MFKFNILAKPVYAFFKSSTSKIHISPPKLAGHSKWANIKHTKGLKDAQRSVLFGRLSRAIRLAVQDGGGSTNPDLNSSLRVAVDEALKRDMPNATIQGVLKKCSTQTAKLKRHTLEIRCGMKIFMVVFLFTENLANSKMLLAPIIKKSKAMYADTSHMFFDKGIIEVVGNDKLEAKTPNDLEEIATEHAIESGAEELEIIDAETKHLTFICEADELDRVKQKLSALGYNVEGAEHVFIPNNPITISQADQDLYDKFKEKLQAFEGIDTIYDNINIEN